MAASPPSTSAFTGQDASPSPSSTSKRSALAASAPTKKPVSLRPRQRRYVAAILDGKTKSDAVRAAGYKIEPKRGLSEAEQASQVAYAASRSVAVVQALSGQVLDYRFDMASGRLIRDRITQKLMEIVENPVTSDSTKINAIKTAGKLGVVNAFDSNAAVAAAIHESPKEARDGLMSKLQMMMDSIRSANKRDEELAKT